MNGEPHDQEGERGNARKRVDQHMELLAYLTGLHAQRRSGQARKVGRRRTGRLAALTRQLADSRYTAGAAPAAKLTGSALRSLYGEIRRELALRVIGQEAAVSQLALAGALHVTAAVPGQRLLLIGPSGVGKTMLCRALADSLGGLPFVVTQGLEINSPVWNGAPTLGELLRRAFAGANPVSQWARRAIVVIDEVDKIRLLPNLTGNGLLKRIEVLQSLLGWLGGGADVQLGETGGAYRSDAALIVLAGSFDGLESVGPVPTPDELVAFGVPHELATRIHETVLVQALSPAAMISILHSAPQVTALQRVARLLGVELVIPPETYGLIARVIAEGSAGATPRSGIAWLTAALRGAVLTSLDHAPEARRIVVAPDSVPIPWAGLNASGGSGDASDDLPPEATQDV